MASLLSFTLPTRIRAVSSGVAAPSSTSIGTTTNNGGVDSTTMSRSLLEQKFGRKGIKFSESGDEVEMTVRNGSSLKLQIGDAHITSYSPKVYWKDDGFQQLLYTLPNPDFPDKSKGGIVLVLNSNSSNNNPNSLTKGYSSSSSSSSSTTTSTSLLTCDWTVKDVDSDSIDALQVELSCTSGSLDLTYVVSLYSMSMAAAIIVKNNGVKSVSLTSAIMSHLKFKKRSGTAINGLQGCSYCTHPPLSSPSFELLSPSEALKSEDPTWFSFSWEPEKKIGEWSTQDAPFTILKNKLSRVYAAPPSERSKQFHKTAPTKYETLDQGRELFYRVIRLGFEDIYVYSPGSLSDKYGKEDYFICTGPASMLVPVVVNPGEEWRGAQVIEHDNL